MGLLIPALLNGAVARWGGNSGVLKSAVPNICFVQDRQ